MEIKLKSNVVFVSYNNQRKMKERILDFISDAKTDKILFKGEPTEINYKLLKKILPLEQIRLDKSSNSINKFIKIDEHKNIREIYADLLNKLNCEYCLIFKQ